MRFRASGHVTRIDYSSRLHFLLTPKKEKEELYGNGIGVEHVGKISVVVVVVLDGCRSTR
jgi:hypothetical protein